MPSNFNSYCRIVHWSTNSSQAACAGLPVSLFDGIRLPRQNRWANRSSHIDEVRYDALELGPIVSEPLKTLTLVDLQQLIARMYSSKDEARGIDGTFMWLMEEVGELAAALREGTPEQTAAEFADVLAWLATIANVAGVDLQQAVLEKYGRGCPGCGEMVCVCDTAEKP